jgi:hypothetical protein
MQRRFDVVPREIGQRYRQCRARPITRSTPSSLQHSGLRSRDRNEALGISHERLVERLLKKDATTIALSIHVTA